MRQGILVYDEYTGRMDIYFGAEEYYGGLHCGTLLEALIGNKWIRTRLELGKGWFLDGIKIPEIVGLQVRI